MKTLLFYFAGAVVAKELLWLELVFAMSAAGLAVQIASDPGDLSNNTSCDLLGAPISSFLFSGVCLFYF